MRRRQLRENTIIGTILASEMDDEDGVTGIVIETADGKEITIFMDRMGEALIPFIDRRVEAIGTIKEMYGEIILTLSRYQLLEDDAANA
jgi:hypothetical protein